ncbi:phosphodiester glycosidase family protein [Dyella sp. LX-66]|uniref:phosphodiester glycosidase family protein n=1 Tax=unclassified Dyella TaxID=2634549 RepID=UPI001BDFBFB6|nr:MULTISPECIES: phosphodiester glycosidase family protein [unclassified Dyella]MBT2119804.1 phosphodiester glycosidase family protein [Dyella sp. LX-1]MBT2142281.1 phosphodiester glycosidase family protein [Dyella sp. LX-66]
MRSDVRRAFLAACLVAAAAQADDAAPPATAVIPVIADATCWNAQPHDVLAAIRQCARKGLQSMLLPVRRGQDGALHAASSYASTACQPGADCVPLADALALKPAPALLLQTSPALLDDVQAAVLQADAASRVQVQPMLERPIGDAAPDTIAPGLSYWHAARTAPRPMMIHVLEIDLATPGLSFVVTPGVPTSGSEFVAEKTSSFARREHLTAAINATYFLPFDGGHLLDKPYVPAAGQPVTVDGVSIAHGHLDSGYASGDPRSNGSLCIQGHRVSVALGACPSGTTEAVGAGPVLMLGGKTLPLEPKRREYYLDTEPRSAIGLDKARRRMWWVVVDGRQAGYSEGITLPELTALLRELGADAAMNLDGGGSATMVLRRDGEPAVVNSPIHTGIPGRERPVGNHLGLRIDAAP